MRQGVRGRSEGEDSWLTGTVLVLLVARGSSFCAGARGCARMARGFVLHERLGAWFGARWRGLAWFGARWRLGAAAVRRSGRVVVWFCGRIWVLPIEGRW